jgi:hypothetical protein
MTKYEKLTADLKQAIESAKAVSNSEDGGSCNYDSLELVLPYWNTEKAESAIESAGLHSFTHVRWGARLFIISVPFGGQGNRRTQQAEAMAKSMRDVGYEASVWYQMD